MAENAEKKNISKLDFNINDAINSLEKIDKKLENIAKTSEAYAKKIGDNMGKALNSGSVINATAITKDLDKVNTLSKTKADQLSVQLQKIEAKKQAQMTIQAHKGEQERQTAAYKSALKQEENNQRVVDSTKTMYDKISEYAKTYIIYQGFNELRQGVKQTIDEMVEMEYQMVQIDRVLNDSSLNIDIYRDKLIQMAHDYGNSFENVADITLRLAQAGYDAQESLALTEKTLLALNTAELDATQATDDMVAVMAQWGLMTGTASQQAETYGNIIDKINKVADNFPTTSADILDALKKTSSAFNLAGASIDETIATIVAAEKASQRGGKTIGTALSNIIQQLKADNKLDLAEELGLNFFTDAKKTEFRPIMEIFAEMSERMEKLKNEGKESSVEMQGLLEMFTVFRRNIGASLLSEMAGEDSTYAQVLETSLNSVGYSLQENSKHMQTAKAAQAQFNAELLKLKTQIWEGGLEDVFRDMLNLGTDLVQGISGIIDKFGLLPTTVGVATLAFSSLNKSMKMVSYNAETNSMEWAGMFKTIRDGTAEVRKVNTAFKTMKDGQIALTAVQGKSIKGFSKNILEVGKYTTSLVMATAKTIALQVATVALNAALTMGISFAITAIVTAITNWIQAEEKAIEANEKLMETSKENAQSIDNEITSIQELRQEYEELAKKEKRTDAENQKIYEIQEKLNQLIKDTGTQVELVTTKVGEQGQQVQVINDKYDEQLVKIKAIEYEKKRQQVEELRDGAIAAQEVLNSFKSSNVEGSFWETFFDNSFVEAFVEAGISEAQRTIFGGLNELSINPEMYAFNQATGEEQIEMLQDWLIKLKAVDNGNESVEKTIKKVEGALEELKEKYNEAKDVLGEYTDALSELFEMNGQVDNLSASLQAISDSYDMEGPKKLIEEIQNINTEFSNGTINVEEYFNKIEEKIQQIDLTTEGEELEAYQAIFAATTQSLAEGVEGLISGLESGTVNFADYSQGIKEAADNMLQLRLQQGDLEKNGDLWVDKATGQVDVYTNVLQRNIEEMQSMSDLMTVIGDNYDYIAEHANAAGEAMFQSADVGTVAYTNLANSVAASLNQMKETNSAAYQAIVDEIYAAMGDAANESVNASTFITEALNGNAQALNAALNASAAQVAQSTSKVTTSMGNVLGALGEAISNFEYSIKADSYITGGIGLKKDENGVPVGLDLPDFGYDITGSGGKSIQGLGESLKTFGTDLTDYGSDKFTYTQLKSKQKPYKSTGGNTGGSGSSGSSGGKKNSGGGSSSSTKKDTSAEDAEKARQKAYDESVDAFEDSIEERERLEERWVDRQAELGQLSNEDYLYITQQRIERYKKYLQEIENATWLSEEDKLRLKQKYTEKIEDLEVDYLGYLEKQLEDEIKAIEDANEEKIRLIEEEADAKIAALKKVEDERDRERETEDYQKERQSILDEIAYWEQRTGREAQENLARAKKDLEELDAEWEDTQEDWKTEDQIKQIEAERDAQIAAIKEAEKQEIESLKAVYDAKVKMYVETGDLIYEETVIQSESLYNAYKTNFIDPVSKELDNLNKKITANINSAGTNSTSNESAKEQKYETYTIQKGDTLSKIAKKNGTTVEKILAANPYIKDKNKIYAGKTLQIPKFHEGGIVGGTQEAFALLKPHEVILKPEWAAGINKLAKMAKTGDVSIGGKSTIVEVKGDLVRIDAKINDKTDAEYLTRRIEKMLKDKFNIKK